MQGGDCCLRKGGRFILGLLEGSRPPTRASGLDFYGKIIKMKLTFHVTKGLPPSPHFRLYNLLSICGLHHASALSTRKGLFFLDPDLTCVQNAEFNNAEWVSLRRDLEPFFSLGDVYRVCSISQGCLTMQSWSSFPVEQAIHRACGPQACPTLWDNQKFDLMFENIMRSERGQSPKITSCMIAFI